MKILRQLAILALVLCSQSMQGMGRYERDLQEAIRRSQQEQLNEERALQEAIRRSQEDVPRRQQAVQEYVPSQEGTLRTYSLIVNIENLPIKQEVQGLIAQVKNVIVNEIDRIVDAPFYHFKDEQDRINRTNTINAQNYNLTSRLPRDLHNLRPAKANKADLNDAEINNKNREIANFNNTYIIPYNQNPNNREKLQLLNLIAPQKQQRIISFHEQDPNNMHITLLTIGDMYDGDRQRTAIINQVIAAVQAAIDEWSTSQSCGQLDFQTGRIKWPPYGSHQKIWIPLAIEPQNMQAGASLISLLNMIKNNLQTIQTPNGNCFMDPAKLPKTFDPYTQQEQNDIRSGNKLHISLGRLTPPYIKNALAANKPNQSAQRIQNMIGGYVWVDTNGKAIWVETERFDFMQNLSSQQQRAILNILDVRQLGPNMFGSGFALSNNRFTIRSIELDSKSSAVATDIQRYQIFSIPQCAKTTTTQTGSRQTQATTLTEQMGQMNLGTQDPISQIKAAARKDIADLKAGRNSNRSAISQLNAAELAGNDSELRTRLQTMFTDLDTAFREEDLATYEYGLEKWLEKYLWL